MNKENKEWSFLISICTNSVLSNIDLNTIFIPFKKEFNWTVFYSFAYYNRVIPIVYDELDKLNNISVPELIWDKMNLHSKAVIKNNLTQTNELIKLTKILNSNGLEFIPYKGITLSHFVYQNLGNRLSADLDIMIDIKNLNKVKNVLEQNNYIIPDKISSRLYKADLKNNCEVSIKKKVVNQFIFIDTHWLISSKRLQMNVGVIEMKKESKIMDFFGTKINYLNPEALFIILAMHHYGKEEMDLKQIIDLGMITVKYESELDWTKLILLSKKWKVFRLTLYSLKICQEILNINLPKTISKLINENCDEKFIAKSLDSVYNSKGKFDLNNIDNFTRRIKLHLKIRDDYPTKLKIIYHHLMIIVNPIELDFKNPKKVNTFQWYLTFFKKPFRLLKYI
jgi:RNAse (barnase) inhibitor barstar